jgi:hypothetical protein
MCHAFAQIVTLKGVLCPKVHIRRKQVDHSLPRRNRNAIYADRQYYLNSNARVIACPGFFIQLFL